jgi:5-methylcytosine-specific restriction endonuclease McrA
MNKRPHRITHPILGLVTWREMQDAQQEIFKHQAIRVCTWCHVRVPSGRRTRCDAKECAQSIRYACYPQTLFDYVRRRDKNTCQLCGDAQSDTEADHIIPVSLGGSGDMDNLRTLCVPCHKSETRRLRKEGKDFVARINKV